MLEVLVLEVLVLQHVVDDVPTELTRSALVRDAVVVILGDVLQVLVGGSPTLRAFGVTRSTHCCAGRCGVLHAAGRLHTSGQHFGPLFL